MNWRLRHRFLFKEEKNYMFVAILDANQVCSNIVRIPEWLFYFNFACENGMSYVDCGQLISFFRCLQISALFILWKQLKYENFA